jgi:predicted DNA-binding protein (UPF0251 family)
MGAVPQSHANPVQANEQALECLKLRRDGLTLREIGKIVGVSHVTVDRWIKAALKETITPAADEVRTLEIERMDYYISRLTAQIERGNQVARNVEVAMKVAERRARLLGLDAPQEIDATVHEVTQADLALQELLREAKAKSAAQEEQLRKVADG